MRKPSEIEQITPQDSLSCAEGGFRLRATAGCLTARVRRGIIGEKEGFAWKQRIFC